MSIQSHFFHLPTQNSTMNWASSRAGLLQVGGKRKINHHSTYFPCSFQPEVPLKLNPLLNGPFKTRNFLTVGNQHATFINIENDFRVTVPSKQMCTNQVLCMRFLCDLQYSALAGVRTVLRDDRRPGSDSGVAQRGTLSWSGWGTTEHADAL